ncbi:MAG: tryptophan 2,3-dioxygenase [Gammaproteobacteria bacterium]|nr:tryptophan 2,3-dioxygenase [Gammaproteobacteria bacterium]
MQKNPTPCYYGDYLQLNKLLDSQLPQSRVYGTEAHDETLFIIVHQAYELWFKQILHELRSAQAMMAHDEVDERMLGTLNARFDRIRSIQKVLVEQIGILETMTPLDFLDFRDYLIPASGFQSIQFKEIEIRLGLKRAFRSEMDRKFFYSRINDADRAYLAEREAECSLLESVEAWLERMPFLEFAGFNFWLEYEKAVDLMLHDDEQIVRGNPGLSEDVRAFQLKELAATRENFRSILDAERYAEVREQGRVRLSRRALLAALFINLYRDEPILQLPFHLLTNLVEVDELFTTWRSRHALMVHRMLGSKIGTGGSSGVDYLKMGAEANRVYTDFFNLSTFLLPRSALPVLPAELTKELGFHFSKTR